LIRIQIGQKIVPKKGKKEEISYLQSSLLGWRLLLEPECHLWGLNCLYHKRTWSGFGATARVWVRIRQNVWIRIQWIRIQNGEMNKNKKNETEKTIQS
jgi:hypothetical protein